MPTLDTVEYGAGRQVHAILGTLEPPIMIWW